MRRLSIITLSVLALGVVAVGGAPTPAATANGIGVEVIGLRDDGTTLVRFDSAVPGTILATTPIAGLAVGETVLGIDVRPATGQVHGLTSDGRVAVIDTGTGAVVRRVTVAADPADSTNPFAALSGTAFGVDFNPFSDRLRVVSDAGQNLRVNVDDGLTVTDSALNGAVTGAHGAAYTDSIANPAPTSTTLYDIDSASDQLLIQNPPNNGTLAAVGVGLGVDTDARIGFDIDGAGVARAALTVGGSSGLYFVNLATGTVTLVGTIGTGTPLRGIAMAPAVVPPVVALLAADSSSLIYVDPRNPSSPLATVTITGLTAGDALVGIDVRPATGVLYALSVNGVTGGRLYTIDTATGVATVVANLAAEPADLADPFTGLSGTIFGVDVNPVDDRLRVVSDTDENLRIDPATGLVTTDDPIEFVDTNAATNAVVSAAAYTNSTNPAPAETSLIDVETTLDRLAVQFPANNGDLTAGGVLNDSPILVSFDISPDNRWALLARGTAGIARLEAVELGTPIGGPAAPAGRHSLFGVLPPVRGIAVLAAGAALPPSSSSFSIDDVTVSEAAGTATFTVSRSGSGAASVDVAALAGTAKTPADFSATPTTLSFANTETTKPFVVNIVQDTRDEFNESYSVQLSNPVGGTLLDDTGAGGVLDDDPLPSVSVADRTIVEGDSGAKNLVFTVSLSTASGREVRVRFKTINGTATGLGSDYASRNFVLVFSPGQTSKGVIVAVKGDTVVEPNETFTVRLLQPVNATIGDGTATGRINNDD